MTAIYLRADLSLWALVDPEDHEWACRHVWNAKPRRSMLGEHWYAKRNVGAARTPVYLHVEIARRAYGDPPPGKPLCDHRSGNTLDCRRANLRWASHAENARNWGGRSFLLPLDKRPAMDMPF